MPADVDPATKAALDQAGLAKAQAEARKAAADAISAEAGARGAALKAAIGEVAPSGLTGTATTTDGAGTAEQAALAINALHVVAGAIAKKLAAAAAGNPIYLGGALPPSRTVASSFDFQERLVARTLDDALATADPAPAAEPAADVAASITEPATARFVGPMALLTTAGLVLSGVNAVLSYARTDFTLGGGDLAIPAGALLTRVAADLIKAGRTVRLATAVPPVAATTFDALIGRIEVLATSAAAVSQSAADHLAAILRLQGKKAAASGTTGDAAPSHDPKQQALVLRHQRAVQVLDAARATFDAFAKSLLSDGNDPPPIVRIAAAIELEHFLARAAIGVVMLDTATSSTLNRKNLLSGLRGQVPYQINAFIAASWQCYDGGSMALLGVGTEAELLPYTNLLEVKLA